MYTLLKKLEELQDLETVQDLQLPSEIEGFKQALFHWIVEHSE